MASNRRPSRSITNFWARPKPYFPRNASRPIAENSSRAASTALGSVTSCSAPTCAPNWSCLADHRRPDTTFNHLAGVQLGDQEGNEKDSQARIRTSREYARGHQPRCHREQTTNRQGGQRCRIPFVVFGYRHDSGGPREKGGLDAWSHGDLNVIVSQMAVPICEGSAPHWPDEIEQGLVIYPWRFGHVPLGEARISANASGPLGPVGTDSMRLSGIAQGRGRVASGDPGELLATLGLSVGDLVPDLSDTVAVPEPSELDNVSEEGGPSHPQDPVFRKAVEDHALRWRPNI